MQRFIAAAEVGGGEYFNPVIPEVLAEQMRAALETLKGLATVCADRSPAIRWCDDGVQCSAVAMTAYESATYGDRIAGIYDDAVPGGRQQ